MMCTQVSDQRKTREYTLDSHLSLLYGLSLPRNMAFVRDIKERSSGKPPAPPSLADSSSGFPAVPHRSQKVSAFKRARHENAARQSSHSTTNEQPPTIGIAASGLAPAPSTSTAASSSTSSTQQPGDVGALLNDVRAENENKVAAMSDLERQRELEELQQAFSPGILEMLAQRAQRKMRMAEAAAGTPVAEHEEESSTRTKQKEIEPVQPPVVETKSEAQDAEQVDRTTTLNEAVST